jgi:hypothetical protein
MRGEMDGMISQEGSGRSRLGWLKALVLLLALVVGAHSITFALISLPNDGDGRSGSEASAFAEGDDRTAPPGFVLVVLA